MNRLQTDENSELARSVGRSLFLCAFGILCAAVGLGLLIAIMWVIDPTGLP